MFEVIDRMETYVDKVKSGEHDTVVPGQTLRFTEACQANDRIWQGDLALTILNKVPRGYKKLSKEQAQELQNKISGSNATLDKFQLVYGSNNGSKHILKSNESDSSLDGIDIYVRKDWNFDSQVGPIFHTVSKEAIVYHPTHGDVIVPKGFIVQCTYQREYDKEQERERRARD